MLSLSNVICTGPTSSATKSSARRGCLSTTVLWFALLPLTAYACLSVHFKTSINYTQKLTVISTIQRHEYYDKVQGFPYLLHHLYEIAYHLASMIHGSQSISKGLKLQCSIRCILATSKDAVAWVCNRSKSQASGRLKNLGGITCIFR